MRTRWCANSLSLLLEDYGYRTGAFDELLEAAGLLLLAPGLDGGREAFVGAMGKSAPQGASMPVIALSTALEPGLPEK